VRQTERKAFFSEEKKQKTFTSWMRGALRDAAGKQKSFGSLLQKRTLLLP
jgi:hypothetical protein